MTDNQKFYKDAATSDGVLRAIFVSHPEKINKSDAFIFVLNRRVLLYDAGMAGCTDARDRLLRLRETINPSGRLRLTWVLSHFHIDHVAAAIEGIVPDERFELEEVYLPPESKLSEEYESNGDRKYRAPLDAAMKAHQKGAKIHNVGFLAGGALREHFELAGAKVSLYPPDRDWSDPHGIDTIVNGYFHGNPGPGKVATCVVNASSVWMKISYAGRKIVLTGDSMKREASITDENFDNMLVAWSKKISSPDLLKWPHHGMARDNAAEGVLSLNPSHILVSTQIQTAEQVVAARFPEKAGKIPFHNCALSDVLLTIGPNGIMTFYED